MEKLSGIVPATSRQVWQTGEIEKPRRVSDPTPEDSVRTIGAAGFRKPEALSQNVAGVSAAPAMLETLTSHRGTKINTVA